MRVERGEIRALNEEEFDEEANKSRSCGVRDKSNIRYSLH